jgi:hypothetical protein
VNSHSLVFFWLKASMALPQRAVDAEVAAALIDTGGALDHGDYRVVLGEVANSIAIRTTELEDYLVRPSSSLGRTAFSWENWRSFKLKLAYDVYEAHGGAESCDVSCLFVNLFHHLKSSFHLGC